MTDVDRETTQAIEALVYRLKNRDPETDDEVFALEFLTALRGRGWRPTAAKATALPMHAPAGTADKPRDELLASLRADMEARAARDRAAKETRQEGAA